MTRVVSCAVCGYSGEPDSPERLAVLAEGGYRGQDGGQWAFVKLRGVVPDGENEVEHLVCSVSCAVRAVLQQTLTLHVRDTER